VSAEDAAATANWRFLAIAPWLNKPTPDYLRQLRVARHLVFKVFRLNMALTAATLLIIAGVAVGAGIVFREQVVAFLSSSFTVGHLLVAVLILLLGLVPRLSRAFEVLRFLRSPSEFLVRLVTRALLPALGSVFVAVHLLIFDRLFLQLGSLQRLHRRRAR
jgi:NTE family protein